MGISNQIPNSRLAQPGVCTSTTRPASPYEGQVIYETDTNRVLVYDASAWVMIADTDQPPGTQLIKTQTIGSAVASVTVSDAFNADYDNYLILVSGGTMSADTHTRLTLGSANANYYGSLIYCPWNTGNVLGAVDNNQVHWSWGGSTGATNTGHILLMNPFRSDYTEVMARTRYSTVYGTYVGLLNNQISYSSFTLSTASGTMTGGTIRVYGYRNS